MSSSLIYKVLYYTNIQLICYTKKDPVNKQHNKIALKRIRTRNEPSTLVNEKLREDVNILNSIEIECI